MHPSRLLIQPLSVQLCTAWGCKVAQHNSNLECKEEGLIQAQLHVRFMTLSANSYQRLEEQGPSHPNAPQHSDLQVIKINLFNWERITQTWHDSVLLFSYSCRNAGTKWKFVNIKMDDSKSYCGSRSHLKQLPAYHRKLIWIRERTRYKPGNFVLVLFPKRVTSFQPQARQLIHITRCIHF